LDLDMAMKSTAFSAGTAPNVPLHALRTPFLLLRVSVRIIDDLELH
jgi:hypothetical protein